MVRVIVTPFAIERYVDQLGGTAEEARAALSSPIFQTAADFGARVVRTARARVVMRISDGVAAVLTVLPRDHLPHQLLPLSWGGPPPSAVELASRQAIDLAEPPLGNC